MRTLRWVGLGWLVASACATHRADVSYVTLQSEAEQRDMTYALYTPPGWDGQTPLPLVVFLHGGGDDYTVLDKHPVVGRTFDRWIEEGSLPPFLLVAPDGRKGFWRNWADGSHRFEDWVLDEVVPDVMAKHPVIPGPEGLHLMGISMGGAGSLDIGLKHLDRFSSVTVWSAPIFTAEQVTRFLDGGFISKVFPIDRIFGRPSAEEIQTENPWARTSTPDALQGTRFLIGAGTVDMPGLLRGTRAYHEHLEAAGVAHRYVVYQGGHRWNDWARVFPVALCHHLRPEACVLEPSAFYTLEEVGIGEGSVDAGE